MCVILCKALYDIELPVRPKMTEEFYTSHINENGEAFHLEYMDKLIDDIYPTPDSLPKPVPTALQTWVNNLGAAMYNPLSFVCGPFKPRTKNGHHRRLLLRYLNIPTRVFSIFIPKDRPLTKLEKKLYLKTWRFIRENDVSTTSKYYYKNYTGAMRMIKGAQFYPSLEPLPDFFGNTAYEKALRYHLPRGHSIEYICKNIPGASWRWSVPYSIMNDSNIEGSSICDVGCSLGYHSMILLENGADYSLCLTGSYPEYLKVNYLKKIRHFNIAIVNERIQNYIDQIDDKDILLCLNMFHHVLKQDPDSWWIFDEFLDIAGAVYLMMGTTWGVIDKYNNNVEKAFKSNIDNIKMTPLYKTEYRGRVLYRCERQ